MNNKLISEALGIHWHDFINNNPECVCGEYRCKAKNTDFSTPEGFFVIMEEGPKQKWWYRFLWKINGLSLDEDNDPINNCLPIELINPSRMANALGEFLKEKNNE
jgi:hypothetical protein